MAVLIMTGTIDSSYFGNASTTISDTQVRLAQYCDAIEKYIKYTNFDRIIFAENSRYPFDAGKYQAMAESYGKTFEFLEVWTDVEKTKQYGKSYGEANLIAHAVDYLGDTCTTFYKVTGRVYVQNANRLINEKNNNEFITHNIYKSCLTVFSKMRVDTFRRCLANAENFCDEYDGWKFIEHIYFQLLSGEKIDRFGVYPDLKGVIGSNGNPYDRSKKQLLVKNILLKIGYYDYSTKPTKNEKALEKIETLVSGLLK